MSELLWWLVGGPLWAQGQLVFTSPTWLIAGVVLAGLLALGLTLRSGLRAPPVGLELLLLAPGVALAVFAATGPVWVEEFGRVEPPRYAVLIDDSRSMGVLEQGAPRSDQVEQALQQLDLPRVEQFRFGRDLVVGGDGGFQEPATDLGRALEAISERYAGERLAGVAVITDGLDRGGLRRRFADEAEPQLPELPGPLTLYQVGTPGKVSDLAVAALNTGGFAFIHSPFTVEVVLEATSYAGKQVPITLTRDGQLVSEAKATVDDEGVARASFSVTARKAGRFIYEASIPVYEDDAVPGNNSMAVAVRVVRDRLRVLQVCGAPSFDQKFLRLFLKQDPAVDLVSFFILRTNEDLGQGYRDDELSLIKFPYRQLFAEELDSFDLVIFQNFDYKSFFGAGADELLDNIARYVRGGKAFVMMGGDRTFDLGEYAATPIARILPVTLGVPGTSVDTTSFTPSLTAQGQAHPVTRLLGNAPENLAMWQRLPPLDGLNLSMGAAPGSAVLLQHPQLKTSGGAAMPVLAVREVGRGRTMSLMGDSSWRWVMTEAARGHGNQAYLRFWKNAMRWLVRDPEGERVQIDSARENYLIGETVRLVVRVRDVGFGPVEGVSVAGEVTGPGDSQPIEAVTDSFGEAVIEVPADSPGPYRVAVSAVKGKDDLGEGQSVFAVTARDPELDEVSPDQAFLTRLAGVSGGLHHLPGDYGAPLLDDQAGRRVDDRVETPLWAAPILPLLAGLLMSLSWWVRRQRGLR